MQLSLLKLVQSNANKTEFVYIYFHSYPRKHCILQKKRKREREKKNEKKKKIWELLTVWYVSQTRMPTLGTSVHTQTSEMVTLIQPRTYCLSCKNHDLLFILSTVSVFLYLFTYLEYRKSLAVLSQQPHTIELVQNGLPVIFDQNRDLGLLQGYHGIINMSHTHSAEEVKFHPRDLKETEDTARGRHRVPPPGLLLNITGQSQFDWRLDHFDLEQVRLSLKDVSHHCSSISSSTSSSTSSS